MAETERELIAVGIIKSPEWRTHFNYGVLLAKQGRPTEAQTWFEETLRLEPNDKAAQEYLAQVRRLKSKNANLQALANELAFNPDSRKIYFGRHVAN